jgi:hypothetical protein
MIIYEWSINQLLAKPVEAGLMNVVQIVHWTLRGVGDNNVEAVQSGSCSLPAPDPAAFVPFDDLTASRVGEFVEQAMGLNTVAALKRGIAQQIEDKVNPPLVSMAFPWEPAR